MIFLIGPYFWMGRQNDMRQVDEVGQNLSALPLYPLLYPACYRDVLYHLNRFSLLCNHVSDVIFCSGNAEPSKHFTKL